MLNKTKIMILCVNYNSYPSLHKYLESISISLAMIDNIDLDILIADNSEKKQLFVNEYVNLNIKFFSFSNNLGYLGGIDELIKSTSNNLSNYDYIIISNVDLFLPKNFFIQLSLLNINQNVGWIAPRIESIGESVNRNPKILKRPTQNKLKQYCLMYHYPILYKLYTTFFYIKRRKKINVVNSKKIYAGHGSFMIFTKELFVKIKTFDFPCFLFGEEIYVAEILKKNNLNVIYEPSVCVNDSDHVSTSKLKKKYFYSLNYQAMKFLLENYFE